MRLLSAPRGPGASPNSMARTGPEPSSGNRAGTRVPRMRGIAAKMVDERRRRRSSARPGSGPRWLDAELDHMPRLPHATIVPICVGDWCTLTYIGPVGIAIGTVAFAVAAPFASACSTGYALAGPTIGPLSPQRPECTCHGCVAFAAAPVIAGAVPVTFDPLCDASCAVIVMPPIAPPVAPLAVGDVVALVPLVTSV